MSRFEQQLERIRTGSGFIAALDQSGGSTPKALAQYGIAEGAWTNDAEMFALVHAMRTRIITSPSFGGDRVLGAILFENTMDRDIDGTPTADYLWGNKQVVPFLKVDKGLEVYGPGSNGVQLMKPIAGFGSLLKKARGKNIFGTKMRSVIKEADEAGIAAIVDQQFEIASQILDNELVPIIEPEVDIHCPDKTGAERLLKARISDALGELGERRVMLKLTLPDVDDFYDDFVRHPNVVRVVALSGGYSRDEANARLTRNHGVIASFSRALAEGLTAQQSDAEFDQLLGQSIAAIASASAT